MAMLFWAFILSFAITGNFLAYLRQHRVRKEPMPSELPPVSVLKPLKGADPGLSENLESFFRLDYPDFELLFSVAEGADPAVKLVLELRERYPGVRSRLIVGAENVGMNPKVNNLDRSYRQASADLILISDSNVRVSPDYLRRKVACLAPGVGVVTAVVAGLNPLGFGGMLEATYLNTFYARGLSLAFATGNPCVIGKSMLFRRSVAAQFGGLRALADYLAEDYVLGEEMRKLGLKIALAHGAVRQHVGRYSFRSFWDRHLRWGRIRKAHAPAAFVAEPLFTPAGTMLLAACGFGARGALLTLAVWLLADLVLMRKLLGSLPVWAPAAWLAREALAFPMWLAVASGNTVHWRGATLHLALGGKLQLEDEGWSSFREQPLGLRNVRAHASNLRYRDLVRLHAGRSPSNDFLR
jgi:ceramide glucosyltransferase